jgi:hypothetical protein
MVLSRQIHVAKKQCPNLLYEGTVLGQIPTRVATPRWLERVPLKRDLMNMKSKTKVMNREEEHGANLLPLHDWSSPSL